MNRFLTKPSLGLLLIVALAACGLRTAQEQSSTKRKPASVMSYQGADWLERRDREFEEQPQLILQKMDLRDGQVVADLGSGTGFFSRKMAREVAPSGKVYAVDIQPQMLKLLESTLATTSSTTSSPFWERKGIRGSRRVKSTGFYWSMLTMSFNIPS